MKNVRCNLYLKVSPRTVKTSLNQTSAERHCLGIQFAMCRSIAMVSS